MSENKKLHGKTLKDLVTLMFFLLLLTLIQSLSIPVVVAATTEDPIHNLLNKIEQEQAAALKISQELSDAANSLKTAKKAYEYHRKQSLNYNSQYINFDNKIDSVSKSIADLHQRKKKHKPGSTWYLLLEHDIREALKNLYQLQADRNKAYSQFKNSENKRTIAFNNYKNTTDNYHKKEKQAKKARLGLFALLEEFKNTQTNQQKQNQETGYGYHESKTYLSYNNFDMVIWQLDLALNQGIDIEPDVSDSDGILQADRERRQNGAINSTVANNETTTSSFLAGRFLITPGIFRSEDFDIDAIVKATFGDNYKVADWNSLKEAYNENPAGVLEDFEFLLDGNPDQNLQVTLDENRTYEQPGTSDSSFNYQYFITGNENNLPHYFSHDSLNNGTIILDSWITNSKILAEKIDTTLNDPSPETTSPGPSERETWQGYAIFFQDSDSCNAPEISSEQIFITLDPENNQISDYGRLTESADDTVISSYYFSKNNFGLVSYSNINEQDSSGTDPTWVITTPSEEVRDYDHLTWGRWQTNDGIASTHAKAPWLAGRITPEGGIPNEGRATYNGSVEGLVNNGTITQTVAGSTTLEADFSTRTLSGEFNNMTTADGNNWKTLSVNAGWGDRQNSISGELSAPDGTTGSVNGHFFGPNATEVGGNWQTQNGNEKAAGIYRAKQ